MQTADGHKEIKVGDWVGFKSDIEQYGQVIRIGERHHGTLYMLTLKNENGFDGGYIGGETETTIFSDQAWTEE
jgi:hypothetical protein